MSAVRGDARAAREAWPARAHRLAGTVLWIIIAAVAVPLLAYVLITGPAARREADRLSAQEIDRENRDFCQAHGMGPATEGFQSCVHDLQQIRQRQRERWTEEGAFL